MFCTRYPGTVNNAELSYFHPVDNRRLTGQVSVRPRLSTYAVSKAVINYAAIVG